MLIGAPGAGCPQRCSLIAGAANDAEGDGFQFVGPGKVWLQSLPISRLAGRIIAYARQTGSGGRGEGSILGGIGDLLDGDG